MPGSAMVGGQSRTLKKLSCKVNNQWHEIKNGWARKDGAWTKIYSSAPPFFGVRIKISDSRPNDAVEYIGDAEGFTPMTRNSPGSWANHPLIAGIKPVLRKSNSTWQDLDKRNLASGANITALGNDVFTEVPTWWLSITSDDTYNYVKFCEKKADNTYFKLASFYNGADRGMFHIGCFHAFSTGEKIYSLPKQTPTPLSTEDARIYAQARGDGFDQVGYYQITYLQALLLLLFKGRDGQELIGKGYTSGSSYLTTEDRTTYDNDYGMAGSSDGLEQMSFFWVNNFWGNIWDKIGGVKLSSDNRLMTQIDGKPIAPSTSNSGYKTHDVSIRKYASGYIQQIFASSTEVGFFPKVLGGTANENWCDAGYYVPSTFPYFGASWRSGSDGGPFYLDFNHSASTVGGNMGSRLVYRGGRA